MITQIWVDDQMLDLYSDTNIKHTLQVNDIAEVKDRQASFTNSFTIPMTPNNIQIFGGLGIPSDTSRTPYLKPNCKMKIDGFDFIVKGWMNVTETSDNYKIYVYSGIINFFKAIENKTLGADLDLTEINHIKNLSTVILSFSNPNYKYLISDYNGSTHFGTNYDKINIDYLVPSARVKYIWDKIHSKFNFNYVGNVFATEEFTNFWLTYPKPIAVDTLIQITENSGSKYIGNINIPTNDPNLLYTPLQVNGYVNNQYFLAPEDGVYKISFHVDITADTRDNDMQYLACVNQENVNYASRNYEPLISTNWATQTKETIVNLPLNAGDKVYFFKHTSFMNGYVNWNSAYNIKWELFDDADVSFSNELKDFSITDFVKQILNQFGLTPFSDEHSNTIEYLTLTERINDADVVDWSDKFIKRTGESYIYESYAQQNTFSYQYNDKESNYSDGILKVVNLNIPDKKEVFKSKMYSPERDFVKFKINNSLDETLRVFKFYDKQVREKNGQIEIEYKGLEKRFHFARERTVTSTAVIGSKALQQEQTVSSLPLADFKGLDWSSLLQKNYNVFGKILNDSRLHDIDLNLNVVDYLIVDLRKLYFFEQEQQYYILNRLIFDNTKSKGEFIRVKRYYDTSIIVDPTDPTESTIAITWEDGTNTPKSGLASQMQAKISGTTYPVNDPFIAYEWQKLNGINWIGLGTGISPYDLPMTNGIQKFRMKAISQLNNTFYSNELQYEKIVIVCKKYRAWATDNQGINQLVIDFINCDGVPVNVKITGPNGYHEYIMCASEGSVNTNGTLEYQGDC